MSSKKMNLLYFVENRQVKKVKDFIIKNGVPLDSEWSDYTLLRSAVRNNDVDLAQFLLDHGCRIVKPVKTPINSLVHIAVEIESVRMLKLLLEKGAPLTQKNQHGDDPMTFGIKTMLQTRVVQNTMLVMLLENGGNVNTCIKDGTTLLHLASQHNDLKLVEYLVHYNPRVNCVEKYKRETPLHIAASTGDLEIAQILLNRGANIFKKNRCGQTPLHIAAQRMDKEMIQILISSRKGNLSKFLNQVDCFGFSHFHAACIANDSELVSDLLIHGEEANQTVLSHSKKWVYHTAMSLAMVCQNEETVKALLRSAADVNPGLGKMMIHLAAQHMNKDIVDLVLKRGADIDACTDAGKTALHIAVKRGDLEMVKMLIQHRADLNCPDESKQQTPLHYAVKEVKVEIAQLLIKAGADVNARNINDATPLHLIARRMSSEIIDEELVEKCSNIIESLIEAGCDVNGLTKHGITPLGYAREYSCSSSACALLQHGADISLMDENVKHAHKLKKIFDEHEVKFKIMELSSNFAKLNFENQFFEKYMVQFGEYIFFGKLVGSDFPHRCVAELNRLRTTKVDRYTSMYSIIFKNATAMSFHVLSEPFKATVESKEFRKSFPIYGYLVRQQFKRGVTRMGLLNPAKDSLNILAGLSLPDSCSESVIKYLSNAELENLISASAIED